MAKRDIPEINAGSMADIAFLLLIFFLVTTTMEKDTAYIRYIPQKLDSPIPPPEIEQRNIFEIRANAANRLMIRGKIIENPDDISERVLEFYRMNRNLTASQTAAYIKNPSYKGIDFPFYSRVTMDEVKRKINENLDELDKAEAEEKDDFITFYDKMVKNWQKKEQALKTLKVNELIEIHPQAHIRVVVQQKTEYRLFAKIHSEIQEALVELRNEAAEKYFGESYSKMRKRLDQDKEDKKGDGKKIKALEVLYPESIIEVKPKG
ncbi:MAG: biopolymer transporter ExbD [bacterium]|nr:biopolymer transporter ExbD [bacterium]